ncbi:hypothetical protein N9A72_00555 [bacterium]|nr:hypothetical protein [bacterium]
MVLIPDAHLLHEAGKVLRALTLFSDNPKLGIIQFKQYIFNLPYSIGTRMAGAAMRAFWGAVLKVKNLIGSVGLYGHNALLRTEYLRKYSGAEKDHVSEDLVLALLERIAGIEVIYVDFVEGGEGIETTLAAYQKPTTTKWASGTEAIHRGDFYRKEYLPERGLPLWEKLCTWASMAFYFIVNYWVPFGVTAYVISCLAIGVAPFALLARYYAGIGIVFALAINLLMLVQRSQETGGTGVLSLLRFLLPRGFSFWTHLIPSQAYGVSLGKKEREEYVTSLKGPGLESLPFWGGKSKDKTIGHKEKVAYTEWNDLYHRGRRGFIVALINLPFIIFGTIVLKPFDPFLYIISILYVGVIINWLLLGFPFNPNPFRKNLDIINALRKVEPTPSGLAGIAFTLHNGKKKIKRIKNLYSKFTASLIHVRRLRIQGDIQASKDLENSIKDDIWNNLKKGEKQSLTLINKWRGLQGKEEINPEDMVYDMFSPIFFSNSFY